MAIRHCVKNRMEIKKKINKKKAESKAAMHVQESKEQNWPLAGKEGKNYSLLSLISYSI